LDEIPRGMGVSVAQRAHSRNINLIGGSLPESIGERCRSNRNCRSRWLRLWLGECPKSASSLLRGFAGKFRMTNRRVDSSTASEEDPPRTDFGRAVSPADAVLIAGNAMLRPSSSICDFPSRNDRDLAPRLAILTRPLIFSDDTFPTVANNAGTLAVCRRVTVKKWKASESSRFSSIARARGSDSAVILRRQERERERERDTKKRKRNGES